MIRGFWVASFPRRHTVQSSLGQSPAFDGHSCCSPPPHSHSITRFIGTGTTHSRRKNPTSNGFVLSSTSTATERPANPETLLSPDELQQHVEALYQWWKNLAVRKQDAYQKRPQVVCLTGAGISTEAGIPDYRGHAGSYHDGHKPMVHDQFMKHEAQRKRYWGRSMVGWRFFAERQPALGHVALAKLEDLGSLGVTFSNQDDYASRDDDIDKIDTVLEAATAHTRSLSIITQNVDSLHRRADSRNVLELHGRGNVILCMECGTTRRRESYHAELEAVNADWLTSKGIESVTRTTATAATTTTLRPDGDAEVAATIGYDDFQLPNCPNCQTGFYKPDVVFFGDSVPLHRVAQCQAVIEACDGLLVVGTSLAVHSAFRHVRAAYGLGNPIAIVNVGPTRAETEFGSSSHNILKVEAPAGPTLDGLVRRFEQDNANDLQQ